MHKYQKINNVKGHCIQNCQYLYDCITKNGLSDTIKPKAVIVSYHLDNENIAFHVHMILQDADGTIIDPSFEIASVKGTYHTSIKGFIDSFKNDKSLGAHYKEIIKTTASKFLSFIPFTYRIMDNNGPIITDKLHYNLQADWIEKYV